MERGGPAQAENQTPSTESDQSVQPVKSVRRTKGDDGLAMRRVRGEMQSSPENQVQTQRQASRH